MQTAEILAQASGIPYAITDALREYDCGVLEGKSDPESWQLYRPRLLQDWLAHGHRAAQIEDGESFLALQARFVPLIEHLVDAHQLSNDGIILVGHGGLYRCMLPLVLTNLGGEIWAYSPFEQYRVCSSQTASEQTSLFDVGQTADLKPHHS